MVKTASMKLREMFPNFLVLLFFVEMWERFSYYGMRALLVLYLTSQLGFEDKKAYAVYSAFAALCYAGPVIGGWLADQFTGFRNMVTLGGSIITIGHIILATGDGSTQITYLGLAFIAIGTGLFKGNISNLLGACYTPEDTRRSQGFTLFYVSVNVGSCMAALSCGYLAEKYGWQYGFGLAGIGMALGLVLFLHKQNILGDIGLSPRPELMEKKYYGLKPMSLIFVASVAVAILIAQLFAYNTIFTSLLQYFGMVVFAIVSYMIYSSESQLRMRLIALAVMIIFLMMFFALEMQLGSLINLFAKRNIERELFGMVIPASWSQSINPFSIIIFGSFFSSAVNLSAKYDIPRIFFAMLMMAGCFLVLYIGCSMADANSKVPIIYLLGGASLIGLGEVLIAPVIFSQLTLLVPKKLQGFFMGVMMLSLAFSNLAGIIISEFMSVPTVDGAVDPAQSLAIYQSGFLDIAVFNLVLALLFVPLGYYLHRIIHSKLAN